MRRRIHRLPLGIALLAVGIWLILAPSLLLAEEPSRPILENTLPIGLTEEEMTRLDEIGMNHRSTDPPSGPIRQCAEWEPVTGVLIRYNYGFGIPYSLIREYAEDIEVHVLVTSSQQSSCYSNLSANGVNMANVEFINVSTNSIWTRDYGPQFVFANNRWAIVDHIYNRPRPADDAVNWALGPEWGGDVYGTDLIHTGGNYMCDGHGRGFSTDLVWDENPSLTHAQLSQEMEDYLGITDYQVVPDISAYGIHHIDCWCKLLDEETILVKEVWSSHPDYPELEANVAYLEGLTNCYGRPYNVVRVYCGSIGGNDVAAYTNSLILNNKVFVPIFGISSDAGALATYEAAMPGYEVLGYSGSWYDDDAIHCRGMGIHDKHMLRVDTNRLTDLDENVGDYQVTAFIDDRSEAGLVTDSLLVYWRLEGDVLFDAVTMQATADPDSYYADIPHQADEVDIEYYIFAKDNSDRREKRPMSAPAAWYTFNTGTTPTSVAEGGFSPVSVALLESYPNPFNPVMTARYQVVSPGPVDLSVYSTEGRLIRRLVDREVDAGSHEAIWDGTDASGRPVSSGVYFLRLVTRDESASRRVVLLK
jgi:agmatine/peptidylarginine deiminase